MPNVVIADQSCEFGSKTLINAGAYELVNTGGDVLSIGAVTGTASTQYTAAVVGGQIVLTAQVGSPTAGTVIIADVTGVDTVNVGSVTVTVSTIPNSYSVSTPAEHYAAGMLSSLIYGDTIFYRNGEYNPSRVTTNTIKRTAPLVGTWTGSNYVKFRPHNGATAVNWWWLRIDGFAQKSTFFHFTRSEDTLSTINFKISDDGVLTATFGALNFLNGVGYWKVSYCDFAGNTGVTPITASGLTAGIRMTGSGGGGNIYINNNTFYAVYDGVGLFGEVNDSTCVDNIIVEAWNDCIKFGPANNVTISRNLMKDKKYGSGGLHGDYIQGVFAGDTAPTTGLVLEDNIAYRGDGTAGSDDGQFIFITGGTLAVTATIRNNFGLIQFTNGILLSNALNSFIENNTVITDNPSTSTQSAGISAGSGSLGGNSVKNNVSITAVSGFVGVGDVVTNNIALTKSEAAYLTAFYDPKYGTNVTDPATHYAAKSGGVLDLATTVGAFPVYSGGPVVISPNIITNISQPIAKTAIEPVTG